MRTKLALGAALLAAGLASSMAQNVYSLNVVGYVNVSVQANKFYMLANPLANTSGANVVSNIFTGLDDAWSGSLVYPWTGAGYGDLDSYFGVAGGWYPGNTDVTPGKGFFFNPATSGTVTFVGQVTTTNSFALASGFNMVGSAFPASLDLVSLGLKGQADDIVYRWNPAGQSFMDLVSYFGGYGWFDAGFPGGTGGPTNGPSLNVGEGIFYLNTHAPVNWVQTFTIN